MPATRTDFTTCTPALLTVMRPDGRVAIRHASHAPTALAGRRTPWRNNGLKRTRATRRDVARTDLSEIPTLVRRGAAARARRSCISPSASREIIFLAAAGLMSHAKKDAC